MHELWKEHDERVRLLSCRARRRQAKLQSDLMDQSRGMKLKFELKLEPLNKW